MGRQFVIGRHGRGVDWDAPTMMPSATISPSRARTAAARAVARIGDVVRSGRSSIMLPAVVAILLALSFHLTLTALERASRKQIAAGNFATIDYQAISRPTGEPPIIVRVVDTHRQPVKVEWSHNQGRSTSAMAGDRRIMKRTDWPGELKFEFPLPPAMLGSSAVWLHITVGSERSVSVRLDRVGLPL